MVVLPDINKPAIINVGSEPISIDDIIIVIDFSDSESYENLLSTIRENKTYEYIILDGNFKGNFSDISLKKPSDECKKALPISKIEDNLYSVTFKVDSSDCSNFKWWYILLICLGVVIVIVGVIAIVYYINYNRKFNNTK